MRKLLQACALLIAFGTSPVYAATALLLSTDESNNGDTVVYVNAALSSLEEALGPTRVTDKRGALSDSASVDLSDADFTGQNIVLLVSGYEPIDAARWAIVKNQLFTNPDTIFLFFIDGCCSNASNIDAVVQALDEATGLGLRSQRYANTVYNWSTLNINSPYSSDFESQLYITGLDAALISNVPAPLALYLPPDAPTLTPHIDERVDTLGFLVPKALNNEGQGACTFVLADSNTMEHQAALMVANFTRAALNPAGACQLQFPSVDLSVTLAPTFSAPLNTALSLPIAVTNLGDEESIGGEVHIVFPSGLRVLHDSSPANCQRTSYDPGDEIDHWTCTLAPLAPQATLTLAFRVVAERRGQFTLHPEITPKEVDVNLANNRISSEITILDTAVPAPHPVPLNALWFLLGLSSLIALGVARKARV